MSVAAFAWLVGIVVLVVAGWWIAKGRAWWARVSNTEGGKQIIKEANDVEEWIKRNRGHHIPPYPLPPRPSEPSLAAAAPIAAADPPAAEPPALPGTAAPAMVAIAAPSTVRETLHSQEKSMAYVPKYPPVRQAAVPSAILMLRGFKSYAALAQNFLDIPDEVTKYRYYKETPAIHPLQDYLGISAGWINALDYDGLADGVLIQQTHFDKATGRLIVNGQPSEHPVLSWATGDGNAPPNYRPLGHVEGSGADLLAAFLHAGTQSAYLKSLGLTDEAIAAARA